MPLCCWTQIPPIWKRSLKSPDSKAGLRWPWNWDVLPQGPLWGLTVLKTADWRVFGCLPGPLPRLATSCVPCYSGLWKVHASMCCGTFYCGTFYCGDTWSFWSVRVCVHVVQTQILSQLPREDCIRRAVGWRMGTGCEAFCPGYCVSQGMSDVYLPCGGDETKGENMFME